MDRDQAAHAFQARSDGAGQHPGGQILAEVALGEQGQVEADRVGGQQQLGAEIDLHVALAVRQRLQRLADGLLDLDRADGCHRNGCIDAELHAL